MKNMQDHQFKNTQYIVVTSNTVTPSLRLTYTPSLRHALLDGSAIYTRQVTAGYATLHVMVTTWLRHPTCVLTSGHSNTL